MDKSHYHFNSKDKPFSGRGKPKEDYGTVKS